MNKKISINKIKQLKKTKTPFCAITAYDFSSAKIIDKLDIPLVLVGDSASMVMMGYDSTIPISMDEMITFVKSVTNGIENALVVADMPFLSYQSSVESALKNAGRFLKEGRANAVKIEGGFFVSKHIESLVNYGIPVMGHIGLLPQSINQQSGYNIQGKTKEDAQKLIDDAKSIENAGAFSIVLEGIPKNLAQTITNELSIPTIGIGAGPYCDGQIQVFHDLLGLYDTFVPKHAKQYVNLSNTISNAIQNYVSDVKNLRFFSNNK